MSILLFLNIFLVISFACFPAVFQYPAFYSGVDIHAGSMLTAAFSETFLYEADGQLTPSYFLLLFLL